MSVDSIKSNASAAVNAAIADWLEAVKLDTASNREEFINRYPSIKEALQRFFENDDKVHEELTAPEGGSPGSFGPVPSDPQRKVLPIPSMVTMISIGEAKSAHNSVVTNTRYRELKHFNKGGLGDLYRAYDELLHRDTAVKMINDRAAAEPALLTQFRVEAEITSRLDHPGVVPVYGFGEDGEGRPFYVMRLIDGQELSHAIHEYHQSRENHPGGANTRRQLLTLLEHLASACKTIAYAHNAGIIHCDIKPANIMVGKYGETIVLDWGLAAIFERTKTFLANHATMIRPMSSGDSSSGPRGGTYGYISPEQLSTDRPIAPVSDVYSLGATLYEILTGKPPFDGHDQNVTEKIRRGQFPRPRQLLNSIPRRLEAICLKAMSLEPSERYSTATLLARDLGNWMHDDEILALPDRWYNRVGRRVRRHRGIAATIGLATIVIAVILAWIFHEEERQRQSTAHAEERQRLLMVHAEDKRLYTEAQNAIVLKSLETSLKTLEDLCRPLVNGEMHNLTVLLPAMKTINDFTDEYFAKYENIPSMLAPTARVCDLRATVVRILSTDKGEAIQYYNKAEELYDKLYHASVVATDKDEVQRSLISVKIREGDLYIQRKEFDAAESRLNQAKAFCDELLDRRRNDTVLERDQAEIFHLLGQVNLSRETDEDAYVHNLKASEASFEDSGDLLKKLLRKAEGKEKHQLQRDLARNYGYLGDLYLAQGNISKAERSYEESEDERLALYKTNQMDAENRFQYARGIGNFGSLERNYGGHLDKAVERLKEAEAIQLSLARDFPEINIFSVELAYTQNSLAEVLLWQAIDHADQFGGYLKQAGDAAMNAEQRLRNDTENTHELAWTLVTQAAIAMLNNNGAEAAKLANQAENLIVSGDTIVKLSRSKQVTLALAASLQGKEKVAYQALENAVAQGENTAVRFEKHGGAGLKALNHHPIFGKSYRELCQKARSGMGDK